MTYETASGGAARAPPCATFQSFDATKSRARTVSTTLSAATTFLYTGTSPIQTGVVAGTIMPAQVSTLRGRVLTATGSALPGATLEDPQIDVLLRIRLEIRQH